MHHKGHRIKNIKKNMDINASKCRTAYLYYGICLFTMKPYLDNKLLTQKNIRWHENVINYEGEKNPLYTIYTRWPQLCFKILLENAWKHQSVRAVPCECGVEEGQTCWRGPETGHWPHPGTRYWAFSLGTEQLYL